MNTKEKLIKTMIMLLWERGYAATSPKAIQKKSGVGQGSMYHHFSGKKELAIAAIQNNIEMMKDDIEDIFAENISPLNKIKKYLLRERDILKGCPIGRLIYDPDIYLDDELLEPLDKMFQWIIDKISTAIDESIQQNELKNIDSLELSSTIAAILQGGYVIARSKKRNEPFTQSINGLLNLIQNLEEEDV